MNNLKEDAEETGEKISNYLFNHLKSLEKEAKRAIQKQQLRSIIKQKTVTLVEVQEDELLRNRRTLDTFREKLNDTHKLSNQGFKGEAKRALTKKFSKTTFRCSEYNEDLETVSKSFKVH